MLELNKALSAIRQRSMLALILPWRWTRVRGARRQGIEKEQELRRVEDQFRLCTELRRERGDVLKTTRHAREERFATRTALIDKLAADIAELTKRRAELKDSLGDIGGWYEEAQTLYGLDGVFGSLDATGQFCEACNWFNAKGWVPNAMRCGRCRRLLLSPSRSSVAMRQDLSWEVLPAGWWNDAEFVRRLKGKARGNRRSLDIARLRFLGGLAPRATFEGISMGRTKYIVFEFTRLVFAECPEEGNALYYSSIENWQDVFALDKNAALSAGAQRLVHRGEWKHRVQMLLQSAVE